MTNEEMFLNHCSREEIIKKNIKLVYDLAYRFIKYRTWDNEFLNDLIGEGYIGLCKAVDSFDVSKGIKFSTFACACIKNSFYTYIRSVDDIRHEKNPVGKRLLDNNVKDLTKKQQQAVKRYAKISGGQVDLIGEDNRFENLVDYKESFYKEINFLSDDLDELNKYILKHFYKKDTEIATTFNVTRETISNRRKKILESLRESF